MFFTTIKAFSLTIITALITGIIGLLYGKLFLTQTPPNWFLPKNIINTNNFIAVGSMHNFSYLGGLIGLFLAIIYSIKQTKSLK